MGWSTSASLWPLLPVSSVFPCVLPGRSLKNLEWWWSRSAANYALFVLQFDFVELLDGRRLLTQEARSLEGPQRQSRGAIPPSSHETGFIQYLDSGIWHLAFYNDGKESEVVSFLTTAIGKEPPPLWGTWGIVSLDEGTPGVLGVEADSGMYTVQGCRGQLDPAWGHLDRACWTKGRSEMRGNEGSGRRSCKAVWVPNTTAHHPSLWSVAWCADQLLHLNTEGWNWQGDRNSCHFPPIPVSILIIYLGSNHWCIIWIFFLCVILFAWLFCF